MHLSTQDAFVDQENAIYGRETAFFFFKNTSTVFYLKNAFLNSKIRFFTKKYAFKQQIRIVAKNV